MDESISIAIAKLDWSTQFDVMFDSELNMLPYFVMLRFWLDIGSSDFAVRLLSVIFAAATVPLIYLLGKDLLGTRAGLSAALLLACNAFFIEFAQEARSYAFLGFMVTLSSYTFVRALKDSSSLKWSAYVLFAVVGVYAHFFALLVIAAHAASLAFLPRSQLPRKALFASAGLISLLLIPMLVHLFTSDSQHLERLDEPTLRRIVDIFISLSGSRLVLLSYFLLAGLATMAALQSWLKLPQSDEAWRFSFILMWLLLPIVLVVGVSFFKPLIVFRYFLACLPALILIVSAGLERLRQTWLYSAALAVTVVLSLLAVSSWYSEDKEDWRGASDYVLSAVESDDRFLFYYPDVKMPFDYYWRRSSDGSEPAKPFLFFEPAASNLKEQLHERLLAGDGSSGTLGVGVSEASIADMTLQDDRIWVILSHHLSERAVHTELLQEILEKDFTITESREFHRIEVLLYERKASASLASQPVAPDSSRR